MRLSSFIFLFPFYLSMISYSQARPGGSNPAIPKMSDAQLSQLFDLTLAEPCHPEVDFLVAYVAALNGDQRTSYQSYLNALSKSCDAIPDRQLLERTLVSLLINQRFDDAFRIAQRYTQLERDDDSLMILVSGVEAIRKGDYTNALSYFNTLSKGKTHSPSAHLILAWIYVALGKNTLAEQELIRIEEMTYFSKDPKVYYLMGLVSTTLNDSASTERYFTYAYEFSSASLSIADMYGRYLLSVKRYHDAEQVYSELRTKIGEQEWLNQRLQAARKHWVVKTQRITARMGVAEVLKQSILDSQDNQYSLIDLVYINLAYSLDPNNTGVRYVLANANENHGYDAQAIHFYSQIPSTSILFPEAILKLAMLYEKAHKESLARKALSRAMTLNPNDPRNVLALAIYNINHRSYRSALYLLNTEIRKLEHETVPVFNPQVWSFYYYRGIAYEALNRWPQAKRDLTRALKELPEAQHTLRAEVLNYLAYSALTRKTELSTAKAQLIEAERLDPTNPTILDSLGWAYYLTQDYKRALVYLERAQSLDSGELTFYEHLAAIYESNGNLRQACDQKRHMLAFKLPKRKLRALREQISRCSDEPQTRVNS